MSSDWKLKWFYQAVLPSLRLLSIDPFIRIKRIGSDDNITLSVCGEQRLQKVQAVKIQMRVSLIFYTTLYLVSMCCCNPDISPGRTTSMTLIFIFQLMLKHVSIRENPWNWQIIYDRAWSLCVQIKRRAVLVTRDFIIISYQEAGSVSQLVSDTFYILLDNVFTHHWTLIDALLAKH